MKKILIFLSLCILFGYYFFQNDVNEKLEEVTVVIPAAQKDLEMVPYVVSHLKTNLQHPIRKIVLLTSINDATQDLCIANDLECLDENTILSHKGFDEMISAEFSSKTLNHKNSWYYQQILKLMYAFYSETEYYFVIDADIVLNKPLVLKNSKGLFYFRGKNGGHDSALCAINKLLGVKIDDSKSFIADMMLFNKSVARRMIADLEEFTSMTLAQAVIAVDSPGCRFSEYETYGFYATSVLKLDAYYAPTSPIMHSRKQLQEDLANKELVAKYPYMAYHGWIDDLK